MEERVEAIEGDFSVYAGGDAVECEGELGAQEVEDGHGREDLYDLAA